MVGTHSLGGSGDAACDDVFRWYIRMLHVMMSLGGTLGCM